MKLSHLCSHNRPSQRFTASVWPPRKFGAGRHTCTQNCRPAPDFELVLTISITNASKNRRQQPLTRPAPKFLGGRRMYTSLLFFLAEFCAQKGGYLVRKSCNQHKSYEKSLILTHLFGALRTSTPRQGLNVETEKCWLLFISDLTWVLYVLRNSFKSVWFFKKNTDFC